MDERKKITWADLKKSTKCLYRTESIQYVYERYLAILKKNNVNISEFVLGVFFKKHPDRLVKITKNKFPYYLDDALEHLIIWTNPAKKVSKKEVRALVEKKYKHTQYLLFKNISGSMPELNHYQLIIKK